VELPTLTSSTDALRDSQPGLTSDGCDLQPFRMSSFSTSGQWSPPMNHNWWPFVQQWNYGAMNG
jgi:hypothetical protein